MSETATPKVKKAAVPGYSEAFILRCQYGKAKDSVSLLLLRALIATRTSRSAAAVALNVGEDAIVGYLTTGEATEDVNDDTAITLVEALAALKVNGAFTPKGLNLGAVLQTMCATLMEVDTYKHQAGEQLGG